ncbi:hypothetical protein H6G96_36740 [Nostoc sp. FACHB-892]|uniref:hypothetical protein n=1 Tax=Nostoc sp. FACHB-892 TaxID=2692843 RepID=UPI0016882E37|nr:hypothetical protein [Nostoc sp. FACHB-892]MBD2731681.1 hypothetical protein [Nostoc sp. FACHB-892]
MKKRGKGNPLPLSGCDHVSVMSWWRSRTCTFRRHRLCLNSGEKPSDCHCFTQMMHEYIDTRNYPYK